MTEIWKDIKDYEGIYQVSNLGNIKSYYTKKMLKPYINIYGYCRISLYKNHKCKNCAVHRLVAEAFIPNPNKLKTVNHIDEDKLNNCVDNLEWTTIKDNVIYSQAKKINQTKQLKYYLELNSIKLILIIISIE